MIEPTSSVTYNLLYVTAIAVAVLLLLISAYCYDKFTQAENQRLSRDTASNAKMVSMGGVMLGAIAIIFIIVYYFASKK